MLNSVIGVKFNAKVRQLSCNIVTFIKFSGK